MRTVFIHGEVELYSEAKTVLVTRFSEWCEQQEVPPASALAEFLLDDKLTHDGLLARWSERDLERVLVEVVPRRLALDGSWSVVPEFLHRWLDFLDGAGLLMSGGSSLSELHAAVDLCAPAYLAAMAEPAEWGPVKFWSVTMREHGVDVEDEEAVEGFFAAVDGGALEVDEELADDAADREDLEPAAAPAYWLPPMPVPDEGIPAAEASGTELMARMRTLHEWLGGGRELGDAGGLTAPDVRELSEALGIDRFETDALLDWGKHAGLVRAAGGRLVRTQISAPLLDEPALLWTRLWQSFVLLDDVFGVEVGEWDLPGGGEDVFMELVEHALRALYSQTGGIPLELVVDMTMSSLIEDSEDTVPPAVREALRRMLRRVLDQWEALGVVRRFVTTEPEQVRVIDAAVPDETEPDHTMIELLPLGLWAAQGSLRALGFVVPTVDEMVRHPAEVLVLGIPDGSPDVVEEVVTAWIDRRGAHAASAELAALLRRVDDPEIRLTALWLLGLIGAEGVAAVQELCDDPVAGPAARMWLQTRPTSGEVTVRPGDELIFSLDGMAVTAVEDAEVFLSEFRQQPTTDQIAVIDEIPRTQHTRAGVVLSAIADSHPDERVASAARRSLGRVRGIDAVGAG
jgi:hypothetical protein